MDNKMTNTENKLTNIIVNMQEKFTEELRQNQEKMDMTFQEVARKIQDNTNLMNHTKEMWSRLRLRWLIVNQQIKQVKEQMKNSQNEMMCHVTEQLGRRSSFVHDVSQLRLNQEDMQHGRQSMLPQ